MVSGSHPIFVLQTSNKSVKYVRGQVLYKRLVVEKTMFRYLSFQNSFSSCLSVPGVDKDANDYKAKEATVLLWPLGSTIMQIVTYMGLYLMQRTYFRIKCTDTMEGRGQLSGRGCGCLLALHQLGSPRMVAVQTQFFARTSSYQLV